MLRAAALVQRLEVRLAPIPHDVARRCADRALLKAQRVALVIREVRCVNEAEHFAGAYFLPVVVHKITHDTYAEARVKPAHAEIQRGHSDSLSRTGPRGKPTEVSKTPTRPLFHTLRRYGDADAIPFETQPARPAPLRERCRRDRHPLIRGGEVGRPAAKLRLHRAHIGVLPPPFQKTKMGRRTLR